MNVGAHAILHTAFSFLLCDFDATNLYWYRRPSQQRISTSHVLRRSYSMMPRACKRGPCPWIGLLILLAASILLDPHFVLMIPAAYNNEAPFQFLFITPAGDRVPFIHNLRYYNVQQGGMDVAFLFRRFSMYYMAHQWPDRICFLQTKEQRIQTQISQKSLGQHFLSPGMHGKDEFFQAIQVLAPRFRLFGTFLLDNENVGPAFTGTFCLKKLLFDMLLLVRAVIIL